MKVKSPTIAFASMFAAASPRVLGSKRSEIRETMLSTNWFIFGSWRERLPGRLRDQHRGTVPKGGAEGESSGSHGGGGVKPCGVAARRLHLSASGSNRVMPFEHGAFAGAVGRIP